MTDNEKPVSMCLNSVRISCGLHPNSWMTVAVVPWTPTGQPALMIATEGKPSEMTPTGDATGENLVCSAVMLFGEDALDELEARISVMRRMIKQMKEIQDGPRTVQ